MCTVKNIKIYGFQKIVSESANQELLDGLDTKHAWNIWKIHKLI
jgi:hypothetical protein